MNIKIIKFIMIFSAVFLIISLYLHLSKINLRGKLEIIVFSVGNADSFLIKTPNNKYILIDTACSICGDMILKKYFLDNNIRKIDEIILTHFHSDHSEGIIKLLDTIDVKKVLISRNYKLTKTTKEIFILLNSYKLNYSFANDNFVEFEEPNFTIKTFTNLDKNVDENQASIVVLLHYDNFNMLFMADTLSNEISRIEKNLDTNQIDILKVGHHGGKDSFSKDLNIKFKNAIISTGPNEYNHPNLATIDTLKFCNVKIFRTDTNNAIKIENKPKQKYKILKYNIDKSRFEE